MELNAKDKALCLEREKHRREINELKAVIRSKEKAIASLRVDIYAKQSKIEEQSEWIGRLLEYISPMEEHEPEWKIRHSPEIAYMCNGRLKRYECFGVPMLSLCQDATVVFPKTMIERGMTGLAAAIEAANRRRAWYGPGFYGEDREDEEDKNDICKQFTNYTPELKRFI